VLGRILAAALQKNLEDLLDQAAFVVGILAHAQDVAQLPQVELMQVAPQKELVVTEVYVDLVEALSVK